MQIKTFSINNARGSVHIATCMPLGYSAKLEERGRFCPVAAGVGDTPAAALYDLAAQKFALPHAWQIKQVIRQLPAN